MALSFNNSYEYDAYNDRARWEQEKIHEMIRRQQDSMRNAIGIDGASLGQLPKLVPNPEPNKVLLLLGENE